MALIEREKCMLPDKRTSTRMPFIERIKFGNVEREYFEGTTKDISDGGIGIKSFEYLPENTKASIIMYYGHKPLNIIGKVVWVSKSTESKAYRMGIEFDQKAKELNIIYNYLFK